jgi:2-dehydro-3-deoxygluconokinase
VDVSHVVMAKYDGVGRADRIGLNFTEVGTGVRASVTMYDRGHSAASNLKPGMIDFNKVFKEQGVRWLHTGGIFAALSDGCAAVCKEALTAAKESGTIVSYDLNFRSKLWSSQKAQQVTKELVPHIDCLIGNEEDFQKVLGFEVEGGTMNRCRPWTRGRTRRWWRKSSRLIRTSRSSARRCARSRAGW